METNTNTMNDQKMKQRVINLLVKRGHTTEQVNRWTNEHFDYANKHYSGAAKIANVIMAL